VISDKVPWSPHFRKNLPVCAGEIWTESRGTMILGHLLIHVAKLLNFDELLRTADYNGYNPEAAYYWRTKLNMQPINPGLLYPVLPDIASPPMSDLFSPPLRSLVNSIFKPKKSDESQRSLRVFLCHSHSDKQAVHELYHRLCIEGFDPWLDEEKLLPGQDWQYEITKAVQNTDVVVICLSLGAINKKGYLQNEIKQALDVADEQPEGTIFLIPLQLEPCDIPDRLQRWHSVCLLDKKGYEQLVSALKHRAATLLLNASAI
jgi:hypothetical protein